MKRKTQIFVSIIAVLSVCLFILCACDTKPNKPVVENVVERNGQLVDIKQFDLDTLNCLNLDFITTHMTQFSRLILNYEDIMVAPDGAPSNYVLPSTPEMSLMKYSTKNSSRNRLISMIKPHLSICIQNNATVAIIP